MAAFERANPRSRALFERAKGSLLDGVPMNWMVKWAGPFPLFVEAASGAHFRDVDGHEYVDFCLGDTGAMAGSRPRGHDPRGRAPAPPRHHPHAPHRGRDRRRRRAPPPLRRPVLAVHAHRHGREPVRRSGSPATSPAGPKILVHNHCYHGSVDETFAVIGPDGAVGRAARATSASRWRLAETTRVVEINDLEGLERELANGDVAACLFEPALTNVGIVLPEPGLPRGRPRAHPQVRDAAHQRRDPHDLRRARAATRAPTTCSRTSLTIGKTIGGGIPAGGLRLHRGGGRADPGDRSTGRTRDVGGIGGTLAGNALSLAAIRATLTEVLTDEAFARMIPLAERFEAGVNGVLRAQRRARGT